MMNRERLRSVFGEKNSVKRTITMFSLVFIVITIFSNATGLLQSRVASRQYDEMLQGVMAVNESKSVVQQIKISAKTYAETRNVLDYTEFWKLREELKKELAIIEENSGDISSIAALQRIEQILEKSDAQIKDSYERDIKFLNVAQMEDDYTNVIYLLDRVQNLEVTYASTIYPKLTRAQNILTTAILVILVLMVLMMVEFSAGLHRQIYVPITRLVRNVREISKGNFAEPDIQLDSHNELNYLASAVNGMKKDLSLLIAAREEKMNTERLLKETQFMALQSQVNPHFLFNVLGSATAMALKESADKTLDILESISYMLRYSLQSMKTDVTLRDEMRMVQNYLFLQKQRFGDRMSFTVEFDEEIPNTPIPGMTVQPLVENAVIHGCEKIAEGGWLKVTCSMDQGKGNAVVTVQNNGAVISEKQLQAFRDGGNIPHSKKTTGIGLGNVRDRMRHFYDRAGLMDCEVLHETINVVILRYPVDRREV